MKTKQPEELQTQGPKELGESSFASEQPGSGGSESTSLSTVKAKKDVEHGPQTLHPHEDTGNCLSFQMFLQPDTICYGLNCPLAPSPKLHVEFLTPRTSEGDFFNRVVADSISWEVAIVE